MDTTNTLPAGPPAAGTEVETLLGTLERLRGYVAWKCGGLDSAGLGARLAPSTMTLGGLLKHLAVVEDDMFSMKLRGHTPYSAFELVDWDADPDWEWRTAADDSPRQLTELWQVTVERSRRFVAEALESDPAGLDLPSRHVWPDGRSHSLRRLVVDMIEEYARHVGHIDLIRESIDGLVGEDPA
jgi:hypothetical protein